MSKTVIHNLRELAALIGASSTTNEALSRAVYKNTDCGAFLCVIHPGDSRFSEMKMARFRAWGKHIDGKLQWFRAERNGHGVSLDNMGYQLKTYLEAEPTPRGWVTSVFGAVDYITSIPSKADVRKTPHGHFCVSWTARVPCWKPVRGEGGISISSIVEGTEAETDPQVLFFPFPEEDYWAAVKRVEDEASNIWDQTHGCPDCWDSGPNAELEMGWRPINFECSSCHGKGCIL